MRSDTEWRKFFLLLCECIAVDPSTVRLDGGFRQLFHWIPQHMGPSAAVWHVLEMMPLDVIVHLFRPEVREFYGLERMWADDAAEEIVTVGTSGHGTPCVAVQSR